MATLEAALPYREYLTGVGLDSGEAGNPPEKFEARLRTCARRGAARGRARGRGRAAGVHLAGARHPPRRAHRPRRALRRGPSPRGPVGGRARAADRVPAVERQAPRRRHASPTTRCRRCSNVVSVRTVNSDDPAYFGGYVGDNFAAVQTGLQLSDDEFVQLARNSFEASFLDEATKATVPGGSRTLLNPDKLPCETRTRCCSSTKSTRSPG